MGRRLKPNTPKKCFKVDWHSYAKLRKMADDERLPWNAIVVRALLLLGAGVEEAHDPPTISFAALALERDPVHDTFFIHAVFSPAIAAKAYDLHVTYQDMVLIRALRTLPNPCTTYTDDFIRYLWSTRREYGGSRRVPPSPRFDAV